MHVRRSRTNRRSQPGKATPSTPRGVRSAPRRGKRGVSHGVSVYLVEDNRLLREGTAAALADHGFVVAGAAKSCDEALRELGRLRPRIVLVDVGLSSAAKGVARLREAVPQASVVVMNFPASHDDLLGFVRAGVAGFILKDATLEEIAGAMRRVAAGARALPRVLAGRLFAHVAAESQGAARREAQADARLTRREREVILQIADGLSNKEIAERLHVATHTVKSHVHSILEKLGLRTRLEVAVYSHARAEDPSSINSRR